MDEKEKAWKTVSSKYLFRRPWLTVRCEDMLLPNGNHIPEYYILEYPDWVNTIAITKEGKFVFVRQYRPGVGKTCYELCAGVCEKEDASPLISAQRELWEETGYGKGNWQEYMVISANPSTHTNLTYCFLATDVELIDHQHLEATSADSGRSQKPAGQQSDNAGIECSSALEVYGCFEITFLS